MADNTLDFTTNSTFDFNEQLVELRSRRDSLTHRKSIAERFVETATIQIAQVDEQISVIMQFADMDDINTIPTAQNFIEDLATSRLEAHPGRTDKVRRGAMTAKEKEKMERQDEEKEKKKEEDARPMDKSQKRQPQRPAQPGEAVKPEEPIKTPAERQEAIREKLMQKDPRKQKEGLEELKKPENKDLGKDDPEFQKLVKDSDKRVMKFDKIRESLRKNLKELMQSDSDVVKKNLNELRAGRIGSGIAGFKEISKSTDNRFNNVAKAAKGLCDNVAQLYKEFDIKPEEALSREALNEAKPLFTRQTGEKSNEDKAIDRNSRQNRYMGESNELSESERAAFAMVKRVYGVDADKLPVADAKTTREMEIVRMIVREDFINTENKNTKATLIAPAMMGKGSR